MIAWLAIVGQRQLDWRSLHLDPDVTLALLCPPGAALTLASQLPVTKRTRYIAAGGATSSAPVQLHCVPAHYAVPAKLVHQHRLPCHQCSTLHVLHWNILWLVFVTS